MKKLVNKIKDTLSIFSSNKGFTLIELLIVVLIIGILAAIALPQYQQVKYKAKYATVFPTVKAVSDAMKRYYLIHNTYSKRINNLDINLTNNNIEDDNGRDIINFPWGFCYFAGSGNEIHFTCDLIDEYIALGYFPEQRRFQCNAITNNTKTKQYKFCANLPSSEYRNSTKCYWGREELQTCYTFTFKP